MTCPFHSQKVLSFWQKVKNLVTSFFFKGDALQLQAILDNTVDAIVTADENGIIQSFNKAAEKMFGYKKGEAIGQNVTLLMPEPFKSQHDTYIHNYLTTGVKKIIGIGREVEALKKNGMIFPVDLAVSESKFPTRLFTGIIRDISLEKEAARIAAEMDAQKHFLMTISHDLRTPMQSIIGLTDCLLEGMDGALNPEQTVSLQRVAKINEHLLGLINDLLELAKVSVAKVDFVTEECDLLLILSESLDLIKPLAEKKNLVLKKVVDCPSFTFKANKRYLAEIFINLLGNAVKYTDKGHILVAVTCDADKVIVAISDTGVGIDEADLPQIFLPFKPIRNNHDSNGGIGLSITKRLVELHGGTIKVTSKKGEGSTFTVILPKKF